nr:ATPase [Eubacterium sp.]
MKEYLKSYEEAIKENNTSENGLSSEEAAARLAQNGKNKLKEGKKESLIHRFIMQLVDPMIIILIIAAVISAITSVYNHEFPSDVFIILFVVILNAVLGVVQEDKAEKAIEALQEIAAATSHVIRNGKIETVRSEDLVTGDIIV